MTAMRADEIQFLWPVLARSCKNWESIRDGTYHSRLGSTLLRLEEDGLVLATVRANFADAWQLHVANHQRQYGLLPE